MSYVSQGRGPARQRQVEIGVGRPALFGAIAIMGSLQVGIGWGAEGPKPASFLSGSGC